MSVKKIKKIKHKSIKILRKKAWKLISEYVRRTANGVCYTCGDKRHWKKQNCGHYIHKDALDYEINNLHCQCVRCNQWLSGNLGVYSEKLSKEIGSEEISLMRQRANQVKKWNVIELEEIIETYKNALSTKEEKSV